jgi:pilus assembly protein CpaC
VQLADGQSLAIAGLIKSNVTQQAKRLPGLGEIPILGALFRSTDFINERTELVFVITPRLVKALPEDYRLPTDFFVPPTRKQLFLDGRFEGNAPKKDTPVEDTSKKP